MGLLVASGLSLIASQTSDTRTFIASPAADTLTRSTARQQVLQTLAQQPLAFEENRGQFAAATRFVARGAGYDIALTDADATLALHRLGRNANGTTSAATVRMTVAGAGANAHTSLAGEDVLPGVVHHYRGASASHARIAATARTFTRVTRPNVYDGIDLVYYGNQQQLEYDFIVAPGRDPQAIRLQFEGTSNLTIDEETGDLLLQVDGGDPVRQHKPYSYQIVDGAKREIASRYVIAANNEVRFDVASYDRSRPLVIDPTLVYSSYFGGTSQEQISAIALDAAGNIYVTGVTEDNAGFPTTPDAFQPTKPGPATSKDAFVAKFNPTGTALIFSTFLGGSDDENETERLGSIAVDAAGYVFLTGSTLSADFPVTPDADDATFSGDAGAGSGDAFYTKLAPNGAMVYSTFIGGDKRELGTGIAVDNDGNVYISGRTNSTPADGFVITPNAYDNTLGGADAFLVKFNKFNQKVYATYLGGANPENTYDKLGGVACDNNGRAYLTGDTWSTDFPIVGGAQPTFGGGYDAWVAVIDTTKSGAQSLVYSSYLGGTNTDAGYGIAYAGNGQFVVVGETRGAFTVKNALYPTYGGGLRDGFIAKYDSTQTGPASLLWATYYGGTGNDYASTVAVDPNGDIHFVGETTSANFPLVNAIRNTMQSFEPFVVKLNSTGTAAHFSTFYGSNTNNKAVRGVAANSIGETYFAGWTWNNRTNPPYDDGFMIRNAFQNIYGGGDGDGTIAKIGYASDVQLTMTATPEPVRPNELLTYTISVVNAGTDPAGTVVVTDTLPNVVTFQSCTATNGGICAGGATPTITFNGLGPNALANITIQVRVNNVPLGPNASFTNTATMTVSSMDTNPANNTANFVSHTPALTPDGDDDTDGMPNWWESAYGLNPWSNDAENGPNGDPDGDGKTNLQEFQEGTHPRGFVITYFAEGATGSFFDTRFALANPGDTDALVLARFQRDDGQQVRHYIRVAAHSRATIEAATVPGLESANFSTLIEADERVVADRTMTWDKTRYGSHAERGTLTRTATTWYLAEGATHGNFSLFYLIQNPGDTAANVEITFLLPTPKPPVVLPLTVPAHTRYTLPVDEVPGLEMEEMAGIVRSTNNQPIVVERAMYLNTPTQAFAGGTSAAGVTDPATRWFLAEGATGPFFDMFILIGNPSEQTAQIEMTYLLPDGSRITKPIEVAGLSRKTINVELEDPRLLNAAISTIVTSTNAVPVVVERVMWWPGPTAATWSEAHDSFGETTTGTAWAMAEGETGGVDNTDTYVLLANTSDFAGSARVTLLFEDGSTAVKTFQLPATSRTNVRPADDFPEANGKRYGVVVESLGDTPAQLVVERSMYSSPNGVTWQAGTNAVATKLR
jgi:uncharacterized repeat protein (TIGR01451 family)